MYVVGLDPSLSAFTVADAETSTGEMRIRTLSAGPAADTLSGRIERFQGLARKVRDHVLGLNPSLVLLEGYSYNSRGSVVALGEFGGILRSWLLADLKDRLVEVPPATLKRFATGKGNANKAQVVSSLAARYGRVFRADDEADAYALARLALVVGGHATAETKVQQEAAAQVRASWKGEDVAGAAPRKRRATRTAGMDLDTP